MKALGPGFFVRTSTQMEHDVISDFELRLAVKAEHIVVEHNSRSLDEDRTSFNWFYPIQHINSFILNSATSHIKSQREFMLTY